MRPRSSSRRRHGRSTSRSGAQRPARARSPAPRSAVMTSPRVHARANFQCWSSSSIESRSMYSGAQPLTPPARRSSRSRWRSSGHRHRRRTAIRPDGPRTGRSGRSARGVGRGPPPTHRGPAATSASRDPCRAGRRCHRARAASSSTSAWIQRAGRPVASVSRRARSSMRGLKSIPMTSSAPRFQSESVSRPPAHWRWMARRQRPWRSPISSSSGGSRFVPPDRISSIASASQPSYRSAASSQAARFAACIARTIGALGGPSPGGRVPLSSAPPWSRVYASSQSS